MYVTAPHTSIRWLWTRTFKAHQGLDLSPISQIERHVAAVNALEADAIVLVGDLVDDQVADIGSIVEPVADFSAPDGKYFVQGERSLCFLSHRRVHDFPGDDEV